MGKNRFLARVSAGALVVTVVAGGVLFVDGVATAAPPAASKVTATSTTLVVSPASPVAQGNPVTLTATVTPAAAGTVRFQDGAAGIGDSVIVSNGTAAASMSALAAGSHQLTAVFTPSAPATCGPSTSSPVTVKVTAPVTPASTTTTLTPTPNTPSPQGTPVMLMATVTPDITAGTVQFQDGTMALGSPVPLVGGSATMLTSELAQGTHSLTAVFTPTSPAVSGPSTSPMVSMTMTGPAGGALLQGALTKVQQLVQAILG